MASRSVFGPRGRCAAAVCVGLFTVALSGGCGKTRPEIKGKLPLFPVQGKVVMDGKPLAGATIIFYPTEKFPDGAAPQRPRATVNDDGTFQVSTYADKDGAPAGAYKVTISWKGDVEGTTSEDQASLPELAPESVQEAMTSRLRVKVKEEDNTIPTWDLTERQASNTP